MIRKLTFMTGLVVGLTFMAGLALADDKAGGKGDPPYVHTVIFYLKKDAPKDAVETVIKDAHEMLVPIPTVRKLWIGRPAEQATDIAKKDYQVGLLVLFDDYKGLKEYLDHPKHLDYVKKHGKSFEMVNVYDFVNQKK